MGLWSSSDPAGSQKQEPRGSAAEGSGGDGANAAPAASVAAAATSAAAAAAAAAASQPTPAAPPPTPPEPPKEDPWEVNKPVERRSSVLNEESHDCLHCFWSWITCGGPGARMRQLYINGRLSRCRDDFTRLRNCLVFKLDPEQDIRVVPGPHPLWRIRTRKQAAEFWGENFRHLKEGGLAPADRGGSRVGGGGGGPDGGIMATAAEGRGGTAEAGHRLGGGGGGGAGGASSAAGAAAAMLEARWARWRALECASSGVGGGGGGLRARGDVDAKL